MDRFGRCDARGIEGLVLTGLVLELYKGIHTGVQKPETIKLVHILLRAAFKGIPDRLIEAGIPIEEELHCPSCGARHIDEGEWETRLHKTHLCLNPDCNRQWRPFEYPTVGV